MKKMITIFAFSLILMSGIASFDEAHAGSDTVDAMAKIALITATVSVTWNFLNDDNGFIQTQEGDKIFNSIEPYAWFNNENEEFQTGFRYKIQW